MDLMLKILLSGYKGRLWQPLIETRDLNLLAVLATLLKVIIEGGKFLKLLLKVMLHLRSDLISSFCDDADGFVYVAGVLAHCDEVAGLSVERGVGLFVVHCLVYTIVFFLNVNE